MNRRFWPIGEAAQADYEALREAVLAGKPIQSLAAARFTRDGLVGLITRPAADAVYTAVVLGAQRPHWMPHADPRLDALAASYESVLNTGAGASIRQRAQR